MRLRARLQRLPTKRPFIISTGTITAAEVVFVRLAHDGREGHGEASPSLRVAGETPAGVLALLRALAPRLRDAEPRDWPALLDALARDVPANPAARAALEMAALDLAGRAARKPVHRLLGLPAAERPSSATVVLDAPAAMAREAASHAGHGFRHLKLKLGDAKRDAERVRAVRDAAPDATLRVDANTAWSAQEGVRMARDLDRLEVEMLEQPVPRGHWDAMRRVARAAECPVMADEDVLGPEDLRALVEHRYADGFVLKLMKCGGPLQGKRMLDTARRAGLAVMVSCMIESSLGISAAAHLLARVRWADLDGAWLLARDPWRGAELRAGRIRTPEGHGLGVAPRHGRGMA